ncbi:protein starmaker-like isoform X2 [Macrobrachium rosenbergii]|uniref:protein starmaker-like isoform X2 n=2 Tax=Macrobrachium rosenbergii TaxID=79674 RepID=UPI0034D3CFAD
MSTTVISKLEPSEPPRSPILFQSCGLHQSAENENSVMMKEISDTWNVSENSSPMKEEDTNNCTLDIPMHRSDWNVKQSHEDGFMSESSGCDYNKAVDEDEGSNRAMDEDQDSNRAVNLDKGSNRALDEDEDSNRALDEDEDSNRALDEDEESNRALDEDEESNRALDEDEDSNRALDEDEDSNRALDEDEDSNNRAMDEDEGSNRAVDGDEGSDRLVGEGEGSKTMHHTSCNEKIVLNLSSKSQNKNSNQPPFSQDEEPGCSLSAGITNASVKVEIEDSASAGPENVSALSVKTEIETSDEYDNPGNCEAAENNTENGHLNVTSPGRNVSSNLEVSSNPVCTPVDNDVVRHVNHASNLSGSNDTVTSVSDMELRADESTDVINVSEAETEEIINVTATTEGNMSTNTPDSPEQEVVDVESYQPCVVDLTCEEEDDVDVVAVVEPVIRRRSRRRASQAPQVADPDDFGGINADHSDIVNDDTNNNAVNDRNEDLWGVLNSPEIDLQNPNLTFGSLLEQAHVETVDDNQVQPPRSPQVRRPIRELRRSRRQLRSRSRSPVLFAMDVEVNQPHIANLVHAINHIMPDDDWALPMEAPNQLPLDANHLVAQGHHHRIAQIPPPRPPASPPHMEQPTITCLVCLDSVATINSSSRSLCSTVCGHVFCSACIKEVVKQRKQCPVCRKRLTKKQYHPLFI